MELVAWYVFLFALVCVLCVRGELLTWRRKSRQVTPPRDESAANLTHEPTARKMRRHRAMKARVVFSDADPKDDTRD